MAAKKKTGAFEGDGAERFFSLGNIPKQKLTKKQQKAVDAMNKYLEEICSGGRKKPAKPHQESKRRIKKNKHNSNKSGKSRYTTETVRSQREPCARKGSGFPE